MKILIFFLKRQKLTHKLVYSKTMKSDFFVAILAIIISLFVGYLALNSVGGSSVNIYDLFVYFWYFLIFLFILKFTIRE
jgi:uncharacterized membrane protein